MKHSAMDTTKDVFLFEFETSYVELSYSQFLPGYCVLFSKIPYFSINDMPLAEREKYLMEMSLLGDSMMDVLGCIRINYNLLSNSYPVLHAHLFPRYAWEEEDKRTTVVWRYDPANWEDPKFNLDAHGTMKAQLYQAIQKRYAAYLEEIKP